MPDLMEGKVALVTGGAGAIGSAICRVLAHNKARVHVVDQDAQRCQAVADEIVAAGGEAVAAVGDLGTRDAALAVFDSVRNDRRGLDVLINSAMWIHYEPIAEVRDEVFDKMVAIGLKAPLWTTQAAVPLMEGRNGSIVNVSSTAAVRPAANQFVYSAIKGGIGALTVQSSIELGPSGIRVNSVAPGAVIHAGNQERFAPGGLGADFATRRQEETPLGRLGTPDDVANAALYFASDLSAHVSGVTITVDGGRLHAG